MSIRRVTGQVSRAIKPVFLGPVVFEDHGDGKKHGFYMLQGVVLTWLSYSTHADAASTRQSLAKALGAFKVSTLKMLQAIMASVATS